MSIRDKLSGAAAWFADLAAGVKGEKRPEGETGVAFAEAAWAKWGVKPYRADDLLKSKALRLSVYREMMREPVVKAAIRNRIFRIMVCDWDLRPAGYDRRKAMKPEDPRVQAADFIRSQLENPDDRWPKLLFDLTQSLCDGFALVEKNYGVIEDGPWAGRIGLAGLKAKDVQDWDFDCDEFLNVKNLKQQVLGVWYDRDKSKFIVMSWLPQFENPLGQSEFRAAYRAFWLKDTVHKFRAIYLESLAKGKQKVTYQADQGADGLKKAKALLELLQNSIGMAIPSDLQVEIVEMAVAPDAAFQSALEGYDQEIVIGLEGAVLQMLEGSNTGAFRATETHRATSEPWTEVVAVFLKAAIQRDLVADLVKANFAGVEPPKLYFHWEDEDRQANSQVIERAWRMKVKIPTWYVYEALGIPTPEPDDEVLDPPTAQPLFGTSGGTGNGERGTGEEDAASMADAIYAAFGDTDQPRVPAGDSEGGQWTDGGGGSGKLSDEEKGAIENYTSDSFRDANAQLRAGKPGRSTRALAQNLDGALKKLPAAPGNAFRTVSFEYATAGEKETFLGQHTVGETVSYGGFISASSEPGHWGWKTAGNNDVRIAIKGQSQRDVSGFSQNPAEREVLFGRDAKFKVVQVAEGPHGSTDITLEEVPAKKPASASMADSPIPGDPRDELIARAASRAGPAYKSLFETLKKKARKNSGEPLTR